MEKEGDPRREEVWVRCAWEVWGGCGWEPDSDGEDFLLVGSVGHGPEGTFLLGVKGGQKVTFLASRSITLAGSRPLTRRLL